MSATNPDPNPSANPSPNIGIDIDVDIDTNVAAQMGFSSFGGPPRYPPQGRKRGRGWSRGQEGGGPGYGGGSGSRSRYPYSTTGEEEPRSGQVGQTIEAGVAGGDNRQLQEKIHMQQGEAQLQTQMQTQVQAQAQGGISGLPPKPDFLSAGSGVGSEQQQQHDGGYVWDSLHSGGGGRGRGEGYRGRGRGGRRNPQYDNGGRSQDGYYSPSFIEDPWRKLRTPGVQQM